METPRKNTRKRVLGTSVFPRRLLSSSQEGLSRININPKPNSPQKSQKDQTLEDVTEKIPKDISEISEKIQCPVCFLNFNGIQQITEHFEKEHGDIGPENDIEKNINDGNVSFSDQNTTFEEDIKSWIKNKIKIPNVNKIFDSTEPMLLTSSFNSTNSEINDTITSSLNTYSNTISEASRKQIRKNKIIALLSIDKSDWSVLLQNKRNRCSVCSENLKYINVSDTNEWEKYRHNCVSCGKLFCPQHLLCSTKLYQNVWLPCCYFCFCKKRDSEGGSVSKRDLTGTFKRLRNTKMESKKLYHLKIFKRLQTYCHELIKLYYNYNKNQGNTLSKLNDFYQSKALLNQLNSSWKVTSETGENCNICLLKFNSIFNRKHNCRLCGNYVCDNNCSMEVPVVLLIKNVLKETLKGLDLKNEHIRVCLNCKNLLLKKEIFEKDINSNYEGSYILMTIESIFIMKKKIEQLSKRLKSAPANQFDIQRVYLTNQLNNFESFLKEKIILQDPQKFSRNELQLIQSIKIMSINFIKFHTEDLKKSLDMMKRTSENTRDNLKVVDNKVTNKELHMISVVNVDNKTDFESLNFIKQKREELIVMKEQLYLISKMIQTATRERKFDEVVTLKENMSELEKKVLEISLVLGDEYGII